MGLLSGQDFSTLLVRQPFCKQWMSVHVTRFRGRNERGQHARGQHERGQHARELHVFVVLPADIVLAGRFGLLGLSPLWAKVVLTSWNSAT